MPQPTAYSPSTNFAADELANAGGRSTVRTADVDAEFSAIATTLSGVRTNLALNQRDDGEIRDERVKLHTLSADVKALLSAGQGLPRGAWLTATAYAVRDIVTQGGNTYICATAHTSGTFATDLAAVRWLLLAFGSAIAASGVPFTATGTLAATNVQAAIEEADTENRALSAAALAYGTTLAADLANAADTAKGSALVGHDGGTVGAALRGHGRVLVGADPTGVALSTTALRTLFDACIPAGIVAILPAGTYLVDDAISNPLTIAAGALHIRCMGDVTINFSGAAAAITSLLSCLTTAINNSSIMGGRLTLNLNNKVSNGIYLRHAGGDGGTVDWRNVTVLSAKENNAATTNENQGLFIYGRYKSVTIDNPEVNGVTRVNTGGACKGISISEIVGEVRIIAPAISNILTGGGTVDADGIAVFGQELSGVYGRRAGRLVMSGGTFTDCQGRSIKLQVSDAVIDRPVMEHQMVVTLAGTSDIDAQVGGSVVVRSPMFTYRLNGGTTPIGTGFYPVSLQQQCTDAPNDLQIIDPMVRTEVTMQRFAFVTVSSASVVGFNAVTGLQVQPLGALGTSAFTRAVVEFDAGQVAASSNATHISVRGTRANLSGIPLIGHTSFGASVATKLSIDAVGNENTGAVNAATSVLAAVSGGAIPALLRFMLRDNPGINDLLAITSFDYRTLPVGCRFHYDASTVTASNGPALGGTGVACVEVLGQLNATAGSRSIRVVKDNANAINTVYQTQTGTWGVIK